MKRNNRDAATEVAHGEPQADQNNKNNGNVVLVAEPASADLSVILSSLQTMRDGDFSVRLPGSWTGLPGRSPIPSIPLLLPTNKWHRS